MKYKYKYYNCQVDNLLMKKYLFRSE